MWISRFGAWAARGLTLARLTAIPFFLLLLLQMPSGGPNLWGRVLLLLYLFIALSDAIDGPLARRAAAASPSWGMVDAAADIAFNASSLAVAAWLGLVGPWVPAGVALLGGRFLWRARGRAAGGLPGDGAGKAAGVLFYLLVGAVALELAAPGTLGRRVLARAGDAVFAWSAFAYVRGRGGRARSLLRKRSA